MKIFFFWEATLRQWVIKCRRIKPNFVFMFKSHNVLEGHFDPWRKKLYHPMTQHFFPTERNLQHRDFNSTNLVVYSSGSRLTSRLGD